MQQPNLSIFSRFALACFFFAFLFTAGGWSLRGGAAVAAQAASPVAAPDLIVSRVILSPTNPGAGSTGDIIMVIKNQGDLTATAGFHTYLYVDPATTTPTATTPTTGAVLFEVPLAPGAVYTWTRTDHTFTGANPQLFVWVDPPWENQVAESNEQNNRFPPVATDLITDVKPGQATAGAQVTVTVTASNSHFVNGITTADFGASITAGPVKVVSATVAQVALTIDAQAAAGPRTVRLLTGAEEAVGVNRFTVQPAAPQITAVTPDRAAPGTTLLVTLQATRTHFLTGATTANFGPAINVQAITVTNPTRLHVKLQIGANAALGARAITVTTTYTAGQEIVQRSNGFTVERSGGKDATLAVVPAPTTLLVNRVRTLDIIVTPGATAVNGVQLHGKVDPAYLELTDVLSRTTGLAQVMEAPRFDPATGEFQYAVGGLNRTVNEPFVVLSLVIKAKAATPAAGAAITFLSTFPATDITGPGGSILQTAHDGVVHVTENATGATILGQVDLQGRPAKPHKAWSIPLTLSMTDLENSEQPTIRKRVTTDEQGRFTLAGLPIGRYTVRVKGDHTLGSAIRLVELQPGENRLYLGTLLEGDVEHDRSDNRVGTIDFGILSGALNQCAGAAGYVPNADLDETDDCVTGRDAALLVANFNAAGDRSYASPDKVPAPIGAGAQPQARLTFASPSVTNSKPVTISSDLNSVLTLPLYVDPGAGDPVLAVTGYYTFETSSLEVLALDLSNNPSTLLLQSAVDNHAGTVRFLVILAPDQPIATARPVATLNLRLKAATAGTLLTPVLGGSDGVDLAGANGSVLLRAEGVILVSNKQSPIGAMKNSNYLPIIRK
jgi:hypothetical protein